MAELADRILECLNAVQREREARAAQPSWDERVQAVKVYQQERFKRTYADLLVDPRYAPAARFFLDELYGPRDFSDRDAQFARVVPALLTLFSHEVVETVATLATLHALSESLDSAMGRYLDGKHVEADDYVEAWQATAHADDRERQIALTLAVGEKLDRFTRRPLLRRSLRLMRGPARTAGLGALQQFLETGLDAFSAMHGAQEFLATVSLRERALIAALFGAAAPAADSPLEQLP